MEHERGLILDPPPVIAQTSPVLSSGGDQVAFVQKRELAGRFAPMSPAWCFSGGAQISPGRLEYRAVRTSSARQRYALLRPAVHG
jgi:hypothetical protein